jgi:transcriptional regulator with XRE-family HTH domain
MAFRLAIVKASHANSDVGISNASVEWRRRSVESTLTVWHAANLSGTVVSSVDRTPAQVAGRLLRRLREQAGLTQTELAKLALSSKSMIGYLENGEKQAKSDLVERLDSALQADRLVIDVFTMANSGEFSSAIVADLEVNAVNIREWDHRTVPGLLQVEAYMRAFMKSGRPVARAETIDREVNIRVGRQKIWTAERPPRGWFVIDESVLYRPYGGRAAMRDQLIRLEEAAEQPGLFIQIMPFSATGHPGGEGPLRIIEYADSPAICYHGGWYMGRLTDSRSEVADALMSFDLIRASALPPDQSVALIKTVRGSRYE